MTSTATIHHHPVTPGPAAELAVALGETADAAGFPLLHWVVVPPVLEPGTSVRLRFVHAVHPGDDLEVADGPGRGDVLTEQRITVGGVLAVRTTVEALVETAVQETAAPEAAPVRAVDTSPLTVADPDLLARVLSGPDDRGDLSQGRARAAVATVMADVWRRSPVPVLGLYVDVHAAVDTLDGLQRSTSTTGEGAGRIGIAAADGAPLLTARVWFGCGPRR